MERRSEGEVITHATDHANVRAAASISPWTRQASVHAPASARRRAFAPSLTAGRWIHQGVRVSFHPARARTRVGLEVRSNTAAKSGSSRATTSSTRTRPACRSSRSALPPFITESTFGLPIYRWDRPDELFAERECHGGGRNKAARECSIVYAYALGKAQRVLAGVDGTIGPIYTHGAVEKVTRAYRESGITLPPTHPAGIVDRGRRERAGSQAAGIAL